MSKNQGCLAFLFGQKISDEDNLPYRIRDDFLSASELSFYKVLVYIFKETNIVLTKVSLQDLFGVTDEEKYMKYWNKINLKHVDFLICDKDMLKPLLGIELDDRSHLKQKRRERDLFVNDVFRAAGLPLARVKVQRTYNIDELKKYFHSILSYNQTSKVVPIKEAVTRIESSHNTISQPNEKSINPDDFYIEKFPDCPRCGIPLVIKKSKSGDFYYGCSNYPQCKFTSDS